MFNALLSLLTLAVSLTGASSFVPLSGWTAQSGDQFIADTQANIGYLLHEDGTYTQFPIASGRQSVVHYLDQTYNAATPEGWWVARSLDIQMDKRMFGPTGRFLRLFRKGQTSTAYGIHSLDGIDDVLASDDRYISFGCILVSENVMDLLIETFKQNDGALKVVTTRSITPHDMFTAKQQ